MKRVFTLLFFAASFAAFLGAVPGRLTASTIGGAVLIRSNALDRYVRIDSAGGLVASDVSWDGRLDNLFIQFNNQDGTVSFLSMKNGKYVTAADSSTQLAANASAISSLQKFTIKTSYFSGWSDPGTDKAIFSNAISTTWNIAGDSDGRIFSQWWDEASGWGNLSVMPVSLPHLPQIGVDVSEGKGAQDAGVQFKDLTGNAPKHYLDILKSHGFQWARCRVNVNPDGTLGVLQTAAYAQSVLHDAKARGYKVLLDFHFSDTWADPSNQKTPAAWAGQDITTLTQTVYNYVTSVMNLMTSAHAWPDMVQIGNETDSGMLWPLGGPWNGGSWENYRALHNAAYDAIQASCVGQPMPKIMIHLAKGGDVGGTRWWIDTALSYGFKFDVIGLSYYPQWHGTIEQMKSNLDNLSYRYPQLKVAIAETAYYFVDTGSYPGMPYPETQDGQFNFLRAVKGQVSLTKNTDYVFYWGACWSQPDKWYRPWDSVAYDTSYRALFDGNARAVKAIDALR